MLWFVLSWLVLRFPNLPAPLPIFETVPNAPITISITLIFMFHSFFSSLTRFKYLSFFSLSLIFTLCSAETATSTIRPVLIFVLIITRSGLLAWVRWFVCISKSQKICASHSLERIPCSASGIVKLKLPAVTMIPIVEGALGTIG